jgi:hypothetical protein
MLAIRFCLRRSPSLAVTLKEPFGCGHRTLDLGLALVYRQQI